MGGNIEQKIHGSVTKTDNKPSGKTCKSGKLSKRKHCNHEKNVRKQKLQVRKVGRKARIHVSGQKAKQYNKDGLCAQKPGGGNFSKSQSLSQDKRAC